MLLSNSVLKKYTFLKMFDKITVLLLQKLIVNFFLTKYLFNLHQFDNIKTQRINMS